MVVLSPRRVVAFSRANLNRTATIRTVSIHAALTPSAEAVDLARRVLAAEAASPGAARLDGRMIDRPVVLQAERTLRRAGA